MPEGDTVWRAAQTLRRALVGEVLVRSDLRVPAHATANLDGRTVSAVTSRGKHLLIELASSAQSSPSLVLHTTLGMDGAWRIFEPTQKWSGGPTFQIRAILQTAGSTAVGYRLPHVNLVRSGDENRFVGHLGPDLLGPDWDPSLALQNLRAHPSRQLAVALMDQRNLAGIGNVYKSELCFIARANPWQPISEVSNLPGIVDEAYRLLTLNRESTRRVTTGNPRQPLWVYRREHQGCRVCGGRLRVADQGPSTQRRQTWWCEHCQPKIRR
mgnify:FL=1